MYAIRSYYAYGYSENSSSSTAYTPEDSKQDNVKDDIEANSDEPPVEDWIAPEGASLKALLTEWSDKSGCRLVCRITSYNVCYTKLLRIWLLT